MHSITVIVGPAGAQLKFLYKTGEAARAALENAWGDPTLFAITDDFSQRLDAPATAIHGTLIEDTDATGQAWILSQLHQARVQVMAQKAADEDQELRVARKSMEARMALMNGGHPGAMPPRM